MGIASAKKCHYCNSIVDGPYVDGECTGECKHGQQVISLTPTEKHILESLLEKYGKSIVKSAITGGYVSRVSHEDAVRTLKKKIANIKPIPPKV